MSRSCWLLFAFVARAVAEEYETEFPPSPAPISTDGESVCEGHGYDATECKNIGCCCHDDGKCWSAVGRGACYNSGTPDCSHDDDEGFEYAAIAPISICVFTFAFIVYRRRKAAADQRAAAQTQEYQLTSSAQPGAPIDARW